jgi:hypothetical protein
MESSGASAKHLMADIKISVSLSLGLYFVNHHGPAPMPPHQGFATYVWTTYYRTPGFTSEAIPDRPTAARRSDHQLRKEDLNKEATS